MQRSRREIALSILKASLELRSFVVEEASLADLLSRAWRPVAGKLRKQLGGAINFRTGAFSPPAAFSADLWLTPEMFNAELEKQWAAIEKRVDLYLSRAYRRAFA